MNSRKRIVIVLTASAIAASILFPPWKINGDTQDLDMGYWWITHPPIHHTSAYRSYTASIDYKKLIVQWIGIISIGAAAYTWFHGTNNGEDNE